MDPKEKLIQIQQELEVYRNLFAQATEVILDQDITKYPIFVVHTDTIDMGIPLVERGEQTGKWSINASSLEEFSAKQLIQQEKIEEFKKIYKNPQEHHCLFLLSDLGARFIFIPALTE
jgi:hypothetical protein